MIEYRFVTNSDVENIVPTIYDIWLNQEDGSVNDAIEVSEGFAYYYRNFPDYIDNKIVLAIDTACAASTVRGSRCRQSLFCGV